MSEPTTEQEWALLVRLARGETLAPGDLAVAIKLQSRGLAHLRVSLDGAIMGCDLTPAGEGMARLRQAVLA